MKEGNGHFQRFDELTRRMPGLPDMVNCTGFDIMPKSHQPEAQELNQYCEGRNSLFHQANGMPAETMRLPRYFWPLDLEGKFALA